MRCFRRLSLLVAVVPEIALDLSRSGRRPVVVSEAAVTQLTAAAKATGYNEKKQTGKQDALSISEPEVR